MIDLDECRQCAWLSHIRDVPDGIEVSCSFGHQLFKPSAGGSTCPTFLRMPTVVCPKPYRTCRDRSRRGFCDRTIPRCAECLAVFFPTFEEGYITSQLIRKAAKV